MRQVRMTAVLLSIVLCAACAKAPADKVATVENQVAEARSSGAQTYMPGDLAKLEGMLNSAKTEIAAQESKFAFLRDYGKAEQLLDSAEAEANRIGGETAKRKEGVKTAAVRAQREAQDAVKHAQDLVAQAPVGKDRAAVEAIKADASGLEPSLAEVQASIDAGDYQAAQAKARAIKEKSDLLSGEIQNAMAKLQKGRVARK